MKAAAQDLIRTTPFEIEVRHTTRFDFSNTPAIHTADNMYLSHFFNALSLIAPITEGVLIRAVRDIRPEIEGTALEADARAFIGQEAVHSREHRAFNHRLEELDYDLSTALEAVNNQMQVLENSLNIQERLAFIVTGEHTIYSIARALLTTPQESCPQDPEVRKLFVWHSIEEMEHQSVCDDIYRHLYGEGLQHRLLHYRIFFKASLALRQLIAPLMSALLDQEARPTRRGEKKAYWNWMLVNPGFARNAGKEILGYVSPGFVHWRRKEKDVELIRTNLANVFPGPAQARRRYSLKRSRMNRKPPGRAVAVSDLPGSAGTVAHTTVSSLGGGN